MQKYELTVVMDGNATPAKKKSVRGTVEKTIDLLKGKIGAVEDWGEKPLAYKIGKSESGNFMFFPLELDPENAKALATKLTQEEEVIRHLLLRKE
jgi:small subunit ribosomal protein S6